MRLRDENKRKLIVQTAIRLFSEQPFHKVRLDDVAEAAGVGKGTVYIYFKNKEELYYSLVYEGLAELVDRCRVLIAKQPTSYRENFLAIIEGLADHAVHHPQLFEIMRTVAIPDASSSWDAKRREFCEIMEDVIKQGNAADVFADAHPERTAKYFMAMIRAVMLYGPGTIDAKDLAAHVSSTLLEGIAKKSP
jgi:AcrR family transcriptional regulator